MSEPDTAAPASAEATEATNKKDKSKMSRDRLVKYLNKAEANLSTVKKALKTEKEAKNKLYGSLVKIAQELKKTKAEQEEERAKYAALGHDVSTTTIPLKGEPASGTSTAWYHGGLWRAPALLPGLMEKETSPEVAEEISFTDLFTDLVIVTAFTRVGANVRNYGASVPSLAFFILFFQIWNKEAAYTTRFETTDLSSSLASLFLSFAVLFGSISAESSSFMTEDATRIMMVAAAVSILQLILHLRVIVMFRSKPGVEASLATKYASFVILTSLVEAAIWLYGIFILPPDSNKRGLVFLLGILSSVKLPKTFLPNNFRSATTKRGVLFILLLGFLLQSFVVVASPFFDYQNPSPQQYLFMGAGCFLLFSIKLLYQEDQGLVDPRDHALLVNRWAGFFYNLGELVLLISTTVLGAGLDLLCHDFLAATASLQDNSKNLICGGFAGVIISIAFIKSMHIVRIPTDHIQRRMFMLAYAIRLITTAAAVFVVGMMTVNYKYFAILQLNDIELLLVLCGIALFLVVMSWLDKAVELSVVTSDEIGVNYHVQPFGFWCCLSEELDDQELERAFQGHHPIIRNSVSADRIALLGGGNQEIYSAIRESQRNLQAMSGLSVDELADDEVEGIGGGNSL